MKLNNICAVIFRQCHPKEPVLFFTFMDMAPEDINVEWVSNGISYPNYSFSKHLALFIG